jgi:5S rRNA maturation endonuclease (ribonuclease M5)
LGTQRERCRPALYNAHLLDTTDTVILVEGEKDANTVTALCLDGGGGKIIGVTSGGSRSWDGSLAKLLRGQFVIVLSDNDAPGEEYAEKVRLSLDEQNIQHHTGSFAGTGAKDVTEYLECHTVRELARLIGSQWVTVSDPTTDNKAVFVPT